MYNTDISILIPSFNRLWSLPKTIESCRGNRCNVELIIIDDGSTDGTSDWLRRQQNIVVISQSNFGKCWAVNKGFEIARGKYIRFLDSDDLLSNLANDEQFELAERTNADVVVSGYKLIDENNNFTKIQEWVPCDDFIAQQLGECDSSHYSAYLFKREFIRDVPHRPDFAFRDDRLFALEVALKSPIVAVHRGAALLHRIKHLDRLQVTDGLKQCTQNWQHLNIYKRVLAELERTDHLTQRRKNAACTVLWPLAHWIAIDHPGEAAAVADWIYQLNPDFQPPEKGLLGSLYKKFGFRNTERLLRLRRRLLLR